MSDLIGRSELLKAMNTWDKFGCDKYGRLVMLDSTNGKEYVPYVHYEDMVNCVKNMPTAYDIDKTETIRDKAIKWNNNSSKRVPYEFIDYVEGKREIGVADDVCEWRVCDEEANVYDTSCRNPHILIEGTPKENNYEYCPYCGKKIKAVE